MGKFAGFIGTVIGSSVGAWFGSMVGGVMTMWTLSAIGAGVGLYCGRRILKDFLD